MAHYAQNGTLCTKWHGRGGSREQYRTVDPPLLYAVHRPLYLAALVLLCYILPTASACSKSSALPVLHILVVRLCLLLLQHDADVPSADLSP